MEVTIPRTDNYLIHSHIVKDDFQIKVALPSGYNESKRYPLLILTDANVFFCLFTDTVRLLNFGNEIPEIIVAGIAYPEEKKHLQLRIRDLTPSKVDGEKHSGGAPFFLRFILEELKPYMIQQYSINEDDCALAGDSFGGLFALYSLFNSHNEFQRYIIGSPSIYWDKKHIMEIEENFAQSHTDLDARVFLSAGELEATREPAHAAMLSNVARMIEVLNSRNSENLELVSHIFPGETHMSVIPATFCRGLKEIYKKYKV